MVITPLILWSTNGQQTLRPDGRARSRTSAAWRRPNRGESMGLITLPRAEEAECRSDHRAPGSSWAVPRSCMRRVMWVHGRRLCRRARRHSAERVWADPAQPTAVDRGNLAVADQLAHEAAAEAEAFGCLLDREQQPAVWIDGRLDPFTTRELEHRLLIRFGSVEPLKHRRGVGSAYGHGWSPSGVVGVNRACR